MKKIIFILTTILILAFLTGCSSAAFQTRVPTVTSDTESATLSAAELAAGTLELQETDDAVTSDQASNLLTLWQAYKEVNNSDTASSLESDALVVQITAAMTTDQIAAIQTMNLTTTDMQAIVGNTFTQSAEAESPSTNQAMPAGAPSDGGMMGGDMGAGEAPSDASQKMASTISQNKQVTDDQVLSLVEPLTEMLEILTI